MKFKNLTASEAQIMKVLWEHGEDMAVSDLTETILREYGKEHKRSTIATFLQRLIDKGYITTYRIGKFSHIHADITEQIYKELVAKHQIDDLYKGGIMDFVACFHRGQGISKEEAEELRKFLDGLDD